jgi:N-acyl-D-amino-acid deacylase
MYDLLIKNGTIVDGTKKPAYVGDIAVQGDRIVAIGSNLGAAQETLDAKGLTVTPGFIDIHSHSDWCPFYKGVKAVSKLYQGITLEIVGNCGISLLTR